MAGFFVIALASCEGLGGGGGGGGRVVNYPTIDEMARIESEMGIDPKGKSHGTKTYVPESGSGMVARPNGQAPAQPQLQPLEAAVPQPAPGVPVIPPNSNLR